MKKAHAALATISLGSNASIAQDNKEDAAGSSGLLLVPILSPPRIESASCRECKCRLRRRLVGCCGDNDKALVLEIVLLETGSASSEASKSMETNDRGMLLIKCCTGSVDLWSVECYLLQYRQQAGSEQELILNLLACCSSYYWLRRKQERFLNSFLAWRPLFLSFSNFAGPFARRQEARLWLTILCWWRFYCALLKSTA